MEIRASRQHIKRIKKALAKSGIKINLRETDQAQPELIIQSGGRFVRKAAGLAEVLSFCRLGYVDIRRRCPHRLLHGRCIGRKCARYWIMRGTGDCGYFWDLQLRTEGQR